MSRNTGRRTRGAARHLPQREEHWPGCETEHHECVLARLREARADLARLREQRDADLAEKAP